MAHKFPACYTTGQHSLSVDKCVCFLPFLQRSISDLIQLEYPQSLNNPPLEMYRKGFSAIYAAQKAGLSEVPALVYEISREEAAIMLVDSNLHREHILPSEKAFAYKLKMEAMKHQGRTSPQVGEKLVTAEKVGADGGDSKNQVLRYVRLTHLIPELLQLVDDGKIALTPAVELSYLPEKAQTCLLEEMRRNDCTPSLSQAIRLKKEYQEKTLTVPKLRSIMGEEKANQKEQLKIPMERIRKFFPKSYTPIW